MKSDILIRMADIGDLEDILRLNSGLFKEEHKGYDKSLNLEWTYSKGKKYFEDRIVKKDGFVEVAEVKGKIIAYVCGGISEGQFYRKEAKRAELENMFAEENFRGVGIGTKLTKDFINWCKENEVENIAVTASVQNKHGIDFYKKLGFKDYSLTLEMKVKNKKLP